jgi:hypothetical protein
MKSEVEKAELARTSTLMPRQLVSCWSVPLERCADRRDQGDDGRDGRCGPHRGCGALHHLNPHFRGAATEAAKSTIGAIRYKVNLA